MFFFLYQISRKKTNWSFRMAKMRNQIFIVLCEFFSPTLFSWESISWIKIRRERKKLWPQNLIIIKVCNEEKICSFIHYHKIELIMMMIEMLPDLRSCQIRWSQRKHDLNIQPIRVQRSWVFSNNIKKRVNLFIWCQNWNWLNCNFRLMSINVISIWWEYNNDKAKWIVYF